MTADQPVRTFRLAYVPGATPAKWARTWSERVPEVPLELVPMSAAEAEAALRDGAANAGLLRLPVDRTVLSAIPLYTETTVVVVPKDHEITAVEEAAVEDLAEYVMQHPLDDCLEWDGDLPGQPAFERPATTADALELVAAGVGLAILPQSLARLHHRRDLTYRTVTGVPQSRVALAWREDATDELMEEFIGIVRGRTANSSRGRGAADAGETKAKKTAMPARGKPAASGAKPAGGGGRPGASGGGKSGGKGSGGRSGGTKGRRR